MNHDHIEAAAVGASAASAAASKLTYSGSAVAVVAGASSATVTVHEVLVLGLSIGEICALGGLLLAAGTFALNAWDKWHARRARDHITELRDEEHDARMAHHGQLEGRPTDAGEL